MWRTKRYKIKRFKSTVAIFEQRVKDFKSNTIKIIKIIKVKTLYVDSDFEKEYTNM